jgi:hypothetical protein
MSTPACGVGGGGVLRRAGAGGSAAGRSAHPLQRGQAPLGHARLRGAAAARARPRPGGGAGAALPDRGTAGPRLRAQRREVARYGTQVTSATAVSQGDPPTRTGRNRDRRRRQSARVAAVISSPILGVSAVPSAGFWLRRRHFIYSGVLAAARRGAPCRCGFSFSCLVWEGSAATCLRRKIPGQRYFWQTDFR